MFLFLVHFHPDQLVGKLLFQHLQLDVTDKMSITHAKEENIRLPVAVRGSKTSYYPCGFSEIFVDLAITFENLDIG